MTSSSIVFAVITYTGGVLCILVMALSLSAGLYLLAEFAEEYPTTTGKIIRYIFMGVTPTLLLLWLDGLPSWQSIISLGSLGIYFWMYKQFPFIELLSVPTGLSMLAFLYTNIMWLHYFVADTSHDAIQIFGFFLLMVWLVPLSLFISMSVNDNVLPSASMPSSMSTCSGGGSNDRGNKRNMFVCVYNWIVEWSRQIPWIAGFFSAKEALHARRN